MGNHIVIPVVLLLSSVVVAGQNSNTKDRAAISRIKSENLWFNTTNAASVASKPVADFNTLGLDYDYSAGEYRRAQTGKKAGTLAFNTQGATAIGRLRAWGEFSYSNISDKGSKFNTLLFDPFDEDFLYTAADSTESKWKRQAYSMQVKAGLPVAGDKLSFGMHLRYNDKIAAKQDDPRGESFERIVMACPSIVWKNGAGTLGVSLSYVNDFVRATPTVSNSQQIQRAFLLRGLGNYVEEYIGSNSLQTMYFRKNAYGAGLQYEKAFDEVRLLASADYRKILTTVKESAAHPKLHGKTAADELEASLSAIMGRGIIHLARLSFNVRNTEGTEATSVWNKDTGLWEVRSEIAQTRLGTMAAKLSYDLRKVLGQSWSWNVHCETGWAGKHDKYMIPASTFDYDNVFFRLSAAKNLAHGFNLEAAAGYSLNLDGAYVYNGTRKGSPVVTGLYGHDMDILSANLVETRLRAGWSHDVSGKACLELHLAPSAVFAGGRDFISVRGGLALYF